MNKTSLIAGIAYTIVGLACIGASIALTLTHSADFVTKLMLLTCGVVASGFGAFMFYTGKNDDRR